MPFLISPSLTSNMTWMPTKSADEAVTRNMRPGTGQIICLMVQKGKQAEVVETDQNNP